MLIPILIVNQNQLLDELLNILFILILLYSISIRVLSNSIFREKKKDSRMKIQNNSKTITNVFVVLIKRNT